MAWCVYCQEHIDISASSFYWTYVSLDEGHGLEGLFCSPCHEKLKGGKK